MEAQQTVSHSYSIGREQLLATVRSLMDNSQGREDPDNPLPPGPWDPVIRTALGRQLAFGPHPDPWQAFETGPQMQRSLERNFASVIQPWRSILAAILERHPELWDVVGPGWGSAVALNPQPLPPRFGFMVSLAQTVAGRAELLQELADATGRNGGSKGRSSVGDYLSRLVDEFCGTGFRLRWPLPGPRPNWYDGEIRGIDLVVMAAQFDQASRDAYHPGLRQGFADASSKLAEAGLARMG